MKGGKTEENKTKQTIKHTKGKKTGILYRKKLKHAFEFLNSSHIRSGAPVYCKQTFNCHFVENYYFYKLLLLLTLYLIVIIILLLPIFYKSN